MATPSEKSESSKYVAIVEETTTETTTTTTITTRSSSGSGDTTTSDNTIETRHISQDSTVSTSVAKTITSHPRRDLPSTSTPLLTSTDIRSVIGVTLIALIVRTFYISHPHQAVFDEIPTGDYLSQYIKGTFFIDVEPPFGKLLLAGIARLFGYDGEYDFTNIAASFIGFNMPFIELRIFSAILGALLSTMAYITMKAAYQSSTASLLAAIMVLFEHAFITNSRYISIDPILLFFTGSTVLSYTMFRRYDEQAFTTTWWSWLGATGLSLALTISTKQSGIFLLGTIGMATLVEFYRLLGDRRVSLCALAHHAVARAITLVAIPTVVYLACFAVHFSVLNQHTHSAQLMSLEYRSTLSNGIVTPAMPQNISFGSEITIEHVKSHSFLHSHKHYYPGGSRQQQVTLYQHEDIFNTWRVERFDRPDVAYDKEPPAPIYNGERIRLMHTMTNCRLHSHDHKAPLTENEHHKEVSAYGFPDFPGDANDDWIVDVIDYNRDIPQSKHQIMALYTYFRLRHANLGCYLSSHNAVLPSWAFGQNEVTCIRDGNPDNLLWRITAHQHPTMPVDAPMSTIVSPSFWSKFKETYKAIQTVKRNLVDKLHPAASRPTAWWPLFKKGVPLVESPNYSILVIGNIPIWLCSALSIAVWALLQLVLVLRDQRGYTDNWHGYRFPIMNMAGFLVTGWLVHYIPYFTMERPLFITEYLPAFYFSVLLSCVLFDIAFRYLDRSASSAISHALLVILSVGIVAAFWIYSPWIYGLPVTTSYCERARLLSRWKWECPNSL